MQTAGGKYILVDYLRGIASLLVVLFHFRIQTPFDVLNKVIQMGEVGVQIFFVLSGYVIYQSMEHHLKLGTEGVFVFIKKRFFRIYPALWASLFFSFLISILLDKKTVSLGDILSCATLTYPYLNGNAPQIVYWTLVYEQQFYLLMALLMFPFFDKIRIGVILASSLFAIGNELGFLSNALINSTVINHWFEFLIGILTYLILYEKNKKTSLFIFLILSVVGILVNYRTIAAVTTGISLLAFYRSNPIMNTPFFLPIKFLGRISYSLYLLHLPVLSLVALVTSSLWAALAASLIAATISYYAFELPFMAPRREKELS